MRPCRLRMRRPAPIARAMPWVTAFVPYVWKVPTSAASPNASASQLAGGRHRLVDVDDVEVAGLELAAQASARRCGVSARFETAPLAGMPGRAAERDDVLGQRALLRAGTAMQPLAAAVRGVEGRQDADMMPLGEQLLGQSLDVPRHAPRVRPRIGGDQGDAHRARGC